MYPGMRLEKVWTHGGDSLSGQPTEIKTERRVRIRNTDGWDFFLNKMPIRLMSFS